MVAENRPRVGVLVLVMGLLSLGLAAGCGGSKHPPVVRRPDQPRLVGGGMTIEWQAPQPGTAYLVEMRTGKIVETRTLEAGEVYSFSATSVVRADEFEQMLGIRFAKAQFLLYFEPADEAGSAGQAPRTSEFIQTRSRS
jgi:hypothetical protein